MGVYSRIPFPAWSIHAGLREFFSVGRCRIVKARMDHGSAEDKALTDNPSPARLRVCMGAWFSHGPRCKGTGSAERHLG